MEEIGIWVKLMEIVVVLYVAVMEGVAYGWQLATVYRENAEGGTVPKEGEEG